MIWGVIRYEFFNTKINRKSPKAATTEGTTNCYAKSGYFILLLYSLAISLGHSFSHVKKIKSMLRYSGAIFNYRR